MSRIAILATGLVAVLAFAGSTAARPEATKLVGTTGPSFTITLKKGGKLVNTTIKTYTKVSQFWTYDEKWFLSQPVYSRDYPPLKS
mgnify:CR=1 FL=1